MKKILGLVFAGFAAAASAAAQPLACTEPGTQFEYADHAADGTLTGYTLTVVVGSEPGPDGLVVTTRTEMLDADRRPAEPAKGGGAVQTGRFVVNSEGMCLRPEGWFGAIAGDDWKASVECRGDAYLIPAAMRAGETLPDLAMTLHIRTDDGFGLKAALRIFDRRVLAEEETAVPAGTYGTVCLTEKIRVRWSFIGETTEVRTWYAPGIGSVRTERRNKRGKLESYSELVSVTAPQR